MEVVFRQMMKSQRESQFVGPLYEQVADEIKKQIARGEFDRYLQLPAEVELASRFGVSSGTMRKALEQLVGSGLITRKRGRGTILNRRPPGNSRIQHHLDFSKIGMGIRTIVFVPTTSSARLPTVQEASLLELDAHSTVLTSQGSWNGLAGSRAFETIVSPQRQASGKYRKVHGLDPSENRRLSQVPELLVETETTIKPEIATAKLAQKIGIESQQPVLCFTNLTRDFNGVPVEYVRVWIYLGEAEYTYRNENSADANHRKY